jgi:RNA polymerase sigma factor (sigma-70 family)
LFHQKTPTFHAEAMREADKQYSQLFTTYYPELLRFGRRLVGDDYLVEESIQETFLYFYERGTDLAGVDNQRSYLYTAFRRRLLKQKAIEASGRTLSTDIRFDVADLQAPLTDEPDARKKVAALLNTLPWRQREAVYLKYFNQLSTREISEVMGIQPQVVSNTIYKALKKLRDQDPGLLLLLLACWSA